MMGIHQAHDELFHYQVNLEKRVRANHPLRAVLEAVDFAFVRAEVACTYGQNGHVSVDPVILLKLMFLLFFDDVKSERELMATLPERLDYLWFLGLGLDDAIPDHSVLSKARRRWGPEVFERLFARTVSACVAAGLVDGRKLHIDASLIEANASRDSVLKSSPELIAALKAAYQAQESKLEETTTPEGYEAVNDRTMSLSDPDASLGGKRHRNGTRPRYAHHRVVDDQCAVITAVESTPGTIAEHKKLLELVEQAEANTGKAVQIVVADRGYGTRENYVACQQRGWRTHLGDRDAGKASVEARREAAGLFGESAFRYEEASNSFICPAGERLRPRVFNKKRESWEYATARGVCGACALRAQCTRSRTGRTVKRHREQALLDKARAQAHSVQGRADRRRRQHLMEGSFAQAANAHHFKRSRWRRLWRQRIQDWLIAAVQNIGKLIRYSRRPPGHAQSAMEAKMTILTLTTPLCSLISRFCRFFNANPPAFEKQSALSVATAHAPL